MTTYAESVGRAPFDCKERPILFSGPMVRALLEGSKMQTRRLVKLNPLIDFTRHEGGLFFSKGSRLGIAPKAAPFVAGGTLWVKETFRVNGTLAGPRVTYRADNTEAFPKGCPDDCPDWTADDNHWRPSIFMRRYASRITLEITKVRIERLQDISERDAEAEGVDFMRDIPDADENLTAIQLYKILWESINGDDSWTANPWVWVIQFRSFARIESRSDELLAERGK